MIPSSRHRASIAIPFLVASLLAPGPVLAASAASGSTGPGVVVAGVLALGAGETFETGVVRPSAFIVRGLDVQEIALPPGLDGVDLVGKPVRGHGHRRGDRVELDSLAAETGDADSGAGATAGTTVLASGSTATASEGRSIRVAIINFNFSNDRRVPYSNAAVAATAFGGGRSAAGFYAETTQGQLQVSGQVFGWYTIGASNAGCQLTTWASQARAAAARNGVNLSAFGYIAYSFPRVSGCSFGGHAIVGGRHSWLNGYATSVYVVSHELGHNLGLWHARARACRNDAGTRVALSTRCTRHEYGDLFDMMGSNSRQLNAAHRRGIGALPDSAIRYVRTTTTLTLSRAGSGSGIRLIRIPRSSAPGQFFDLEFRPNAGMFDQLGSSTTNRGVLVHLDTTYTAATDLLDMTPATATFADAALVSGRSWKHPIDRVTIGVGAVAGNTIRVTITFGPDLHAPSAPGSLTATPTSTSVGLAWTPAWDNVAVAGYRLYRNGSAIATLSPGTSSYVDRNLRTETRYDYALRAFDAAGRVGPAATVSATTLPPDTNPPSAPSWFRATPGESSVALAWGPATDDEGGVAGYQVRRDGTIVQRVGATTRSLTLDELAPGTYTVSVAAVDLAGNVGPAVTRTITIWGPDAEAPSAPASLWVDVDDGLVNVRWTAASDDVRVAGYRIWRDDTLVSEVGAWTRSWLDDALEPGSYTYAVAAFDEAGNVGPARTVTATIRPPDVTAPTAPTALRVDAQRNRSVRLTWEPASDDVGVVLYRVYRDGRLVDETSSRTCWDRPGRGSYVYVVIAIDAAGNESPPSDPLEVEIGG